MSSNYSLRHLKGAIDSYDEANLDLLRTMPQIDLCRRERPIRTCEGHHPPARSVPGRSGREAELVNGMLASGVLITGGTLRHTILFPSGQVAIESSSIQTVVECV